VQTLISPQTDSAPPEPAEPVTVATGVVNLVADLLNPSSVDGSPGAPAGAPAAWSLLAFARREFETALAPPPVTDTTASLSTTSQTLQDQAVANTLTYTAPPDLFDQLIVSGLRLARDIGLVFGLNFGGIVGTLLASQDPPFFLTFGLTAQQTQYEISPGNVWKVWTFTPPEPTDKTVIGIHGGGFIIEPTIMHWIDYTQMARDTGATVVVPMYPLATTPAGAIVTVQPVMADFISQQIDRCGAENVSIHADSGGVTYALGAVRELILRGDPVPASMVLLGGQAYYSLDNPDIRLIDDPFFDVDHLEFYQDNSHAFDGLTDQKDPRFSPLFMETEVLQALPPTMIYVGEVEFLLPDNLLLYQRAVDIGAPISMVVGTGLPHDWALGGLRTYSQTPVVRPDIYRQLGLLPDQS
jgi:acetyl esterase/lipase